MITQEQNQLGGVRKRMLLIGALISPDTLGWDALWIGLSVSAARPNLAPPLKYILGQGGSDLRVHEIGKPMREFDNVVLLEPFSELWNHVITKRERNDSFGPHVSSMFKSILYWYLLKLAADKGQPPPKIPDTNDENFMKALRNIGGGFKLQNREEIRSSEFDPLGKLNNSITTHNTPEGTYSPDIVLWRRAEEIVNDLKKRRTEEARARQQPECRTSQDTPACHPYDSRDDSRSRASSDYHDSETSSSLIERGRAYSNVPADSSYASLFNDPPLSPERPSSPIEASDATRVLPSTVSLPSPSRLPSPRLTTEATGDDEADVQHPTHRISNVDYKRVIELAEAGKKLRVEHQKLLLERAFKQKELENEDRELAEATRQVQEYKAMLSRAEATEKLRRERVNDKKRELDDITEHVLRAETKQRKIDQKIKLSCPE
jgi:hypothetical protein